MGPKGSVMIFVPMLEVICKKEWPNHLISIKPEAAAGTTEKLFPAMLGFRQAGCTCPTKNHSHNHGMNSGNNTLRLIF
jgi:hypothetical protein